VLTAPTGERPAYDAESLAEAIRSGLRPDGTPLSSAMPRYEMDEAAMAGLIESLRYLEANDRRAFGPREIEVTANPDDPRLTGFAAATRRFNEAGGAYGRRILLVDSGNGISLGDIFDAMREDLAETAEARLFERISADGHRRIRWQTRLPPAERDFRLRQRGLVHDETARILLWTDPGVTPPTSVALDAVYADLAVAAPALGSLIERSIPIYLAAPDADVLDAARRDPAPLAYVEGYLAGLALGEALVEAGRAGGQEALRRSLTGSGSRLPISVHRIGG
ncbi:MAG TPA: hypothetical protein VK146_14745, partial [Tabrizicola sp.]|nr:hypothetical protein [Tabrizicola sp.]